MNQPMTETILRFIVPTISMRLVLPLMIVSFLAGVGLGWGLQDDRYARRVVLAAGLLFGAFVGVMWLEPLAQHFGVY